MDERGQSMGLDPPGRPRRVLVVEDDADMRELLRDLLGRAGFDVHEAADGRSALPALYALRPDIVILDISLPRMDGWTTLERIRELSNVPVMMLTAHALELERVRGLKAGADDYVTKPFGRQELLARLDAILRRSAPPTRDADHYIDELIELSFAQRSVRISGHDLRLTPLEFRLLAALVRHQNQVLSTEQLLELVWGSDRALADEVKQYVSYLRRKLRERGADGAIETVRGFGYRYRAPQELGA
jgi:DNA-binding response OmpR family regulator